jgi:ankyrin repeat protein
LDAHAHVNQHGEDGTTSLYLASAAGHLDIVKLLLERGADPKKRKRTDGSLPLHSACANGHLEVVKLLLRSKASSEKDDLGYSPLDYAGLYGRDDIWILLLGESGKLLEDINIEDTKETKEIKQDQDDGVQKYKNAPGGVKKESDRGMLETYGINLNTKLGSGQFGDVWKGVHRNKDVAIKFLQSASEEVLESMLDELALLG